MKKLFLILGSLALTTNSQAWLGPVASTAANAGGALVGATAGTVAGTTATTIVKVTPEASKGLLDQALEIVPKAALGATRYVGKCIENHPGKSLIVMGALAIAAYERNKTLTTKVSDLQSLARTPHTTADQINRENRINQILDEEYQLTLTLSPLSWIKSIINTFVGLRASR